MKLNDLAFPFDGNAVHQQGGSGLTKLEYAALHLMAATVKANNHSPPDWINQEIAEKHAKAAVLLARALMKEIENEQGR